MTKPEPVNPTVPPIPTVIPPKPKPDPKSDPKPSPEPWIDPDLWHSPNPPSPTIKPGFFLLLRWLSILLFIGLIFIASFFISSRTTQEDKFVLQVWEDLNGNGQKERAEPFISYNQLEITPSLFQDEQEVTSCASTKTSIHCVKMILPYF